jgi:hypothetical protein
MYLKLHALALQLVDCMFHSEWEDQIKIMQQSWKYLLKTVSKREGADGKNREIPAQN